MVCWQNCRFFFWQRPNLPRSISLYHIWPLLSVWSALCGFVSALPAWRCHYGFEKQCFPQLRSTYVLMAPMCEGLPERWSYCVTLALTGSTCGPKAWPEWREGGFLRMDYSEACSNQRGRGMTKTSSTWPPPPLTYLPPSALSISMLQCLFSGRPGFLRDGVVDERRKRGLGQRGKDRHRERWMGMGATVLCT